MSFVRSRRFDALLLGAALLVSPPSARAAEPYFQQLDAHTALVRWVGYSADGDTLASTSFDGMVHWTNPQTGKRIKAIRAGTDQQAWGAFSADGRTFAAGSTEPTIRIWNVGTGKLRHTLASTHGAAWAGDLARDGRTVFSGSPEGTIVEFDTVAGQEQSTFPAGAAVWWLALSPEGDELAAACGDGRVRVFELKSRQQRLEFGDHKNGVYCVAYSPDGSLIATAGADGSACVWDAQTGTLKHTLPHFGAVHTVVFSPDNRHLAAGGADNTVKLWDVVAGAFVRKLAAHDEPVWSVAFAPDGKQLASAGADKRVLVWNLDVLPAHLQPASKLPAKFDLRPQFRKWKLGVVAQGPRNTCSVQTFTRAFEFAVSRQLGRGAPISDEYMNWATNQVIGNTGAQAEDRGQFFECLWMGCRRHGFCARDEMPWTERFDPANEPTPTARKTAARPRPFRLFWHDIGGPGVSDEEVVRHIKTVLLGGSPVLAGSAHSVLIVAYTDSPNDPGGGRFVIADSGTGGYVEHITGEKLHSAITYDRVRDYGFSWFECVAEPSSDSQAKPPRTQRPQS